MEAGTYISGFGHLALLGWAVIGGPLFDSDPTPEFQVTDVSVISEATFAALVSQTPSASVSVAQPDAPANEFTVPDEPRPDDQPRLTSLTEPQDPQEPGNSPDIADRDGTSVAAAQVEMTELSQPDTTADQGVTLIPPTDPLAPTDNSGLETPDRLAILAPVQPPAPRVDTTPAPRPEPDADTAPETETATTPDDQAEEPAPARDATAPDQAATEIVTEAENAPATHAPQRSSRPRGRPAKLAQRSVGASEIEKAIAKAQAEATASTAPAAPPVGPPLSEPEKDGLRLAVQKCWNVGSLSSDALRVTVTVAVSLGRDGKPLAGSLRMISAIGGAGGVAAQAYEAARRAILRCGAKGFALPAAKYDHWREIEMTFNPEKMRIK